MAYSDTKAGAPSHTLGSPTVVRKPAPSGFRGGTRTAADASGINVEDRQPIDPRMPHLPPA